MRAIPRVQRHNPLLLIRTLSGHKMHAKLVQEIENDRRGDSGVISINSVSHKDDIFMPKKILMIDGGSLNYSFTLIKALANDLSLKHIQGTPSTLSTISTYKPDLIICDMAVLEPSCQQIINYTRNRTGRLSSVPIIVAMTSSSDRNAMLACLRCGADDYAVHPLDPVVLVEVIRCRLNRPLICLNSINGVHLTDREIEAIHWTAQGKSSTVIATIMKISNRTVNYHITNVMQKYNVSTRVQAAIKAYVDGYITM